MRISVLAFDLSHNAVGRADLLARLLAPYHEVRLIGPCFGPSVWDPVARSEVPRRVVRGGRYPRFLARVPELLRLADGDLVYASKPRPTSLGVGLLARLRRRRPLLLDIDDWELGFFYRAGVWGRLGRALNLGNPNGLPWTWLMERLAGVADEVTVGSRYLQERFGGTLIPHVRDTDVWDPARHDRAAARAALGVGDERVVMFLGTPHAHKGIEDLVAAVRSLGGEVILALVGAAPESTAVRRFGSMPFVRVLGPVAFDDAPRYLAGADIVAVPQRASPETVGQVPAKLFDAMALARPIVATAVSMIPEILEDCGVVVAPGDVGALTEALRRMLADPGAAAALGRRARTRCIAQYSFAAARARLLPLVERLGAGVRR